MNILLIGNGKMGKEVSMQAKAQGHTIVAILGREKLIDPTLLKTADVAIEFTRPEAAFDNIHFCLRNQIPVVSGTTGWLDRKPELDLICRENRGAYLQASNFSIGVHLFLHLAKQATQLMKPYQEYLASITEIHHTAKLDKPSGTALLIQQAMGNANGDYSHWYLKENNLEKGLPITSVRTEDVPGTHQVSFDSAVDSIRLEHIAHNRSGFATGALLAASWIIGKEGVFTMDDVLALKNN
jgi:4-hydroxy-tetrahydrodipicolinate reductase